MMVKQSLAGFAFAALLMVGSLFAAEALKPSVSMADEKSPLILKDLIPKSFGDWQELRSMKFVLPDPTVQAVIDQTYSEVISHGYVNSKGEVVMLTIAYGKDQNSEATAAHRPEFCYTGQGFKIESLGVHKTQLMDHELTVHQLVGTKGGYVEPISYWVTLAEQATLPGLGRKFAQLRYGLQGKVADGMLVRVSSPHRDLAKAKNVHDAFIRDLESQIPPEFRARFFGA